MNIQVRQATPYDISALVVLLERMREESPLAYPPIHYPKLVSVLNEMASRFLCAIAETDDAQIVGVIGATVDQWFFSDGERIGDLFFYVAPEARDSQAARKLMRAMIKYSVQMGLPLVTGPTDGQDIDRKERLYESFGLQKFGTLFASETMFKAQDVSDEVPEPEPVMAVAAE